MRAFLIFKSKFSGIIASIFFSVVLLSFLLESFGFLLYFLDLLFISDRAPRLPSFCIGSLMRSFPFFPRINVAINSKSFVFYLTFISFERRLLQSSKNTVLESVLRGGTIEVFVVGATLTQKKYFMINLNLIKLVEILFRSLTSLK